MKAKEWATGFYLTFLPSVLLAGAPSGEAVARRAFGGIQPVISPDGNAIAMSFQGCIARMPAAGGTLTRLTREAGWDIEPAWSPDGKRIAFINSTRAWSENSQGALEVVVNGRVVETVEPVAGARETIFDGSVPLECSGWLAVRCAAENRSRFAHMNPIWIEVRGHPNDARSDAGFLLKWIDRLEADLRQRGRLPGTDFDHALRQIEAARIVYRRLIGSR